MEIPSFPGLFPLVNVLIVFKHSSLVIGCSNKKMSLASNCGMEIFPKNCLISSSF